MRPMTERTNPHIELTLIHYVGGFVVILAAIIASLLLALRFRGATEIAIALILATVQVSVLLTVFMGLAEQRPTNRLAMFAPLLLLILLIVVAVIDPITRYTMPQRPHAPAPFNPMEIPRGLESANPDLP